jgi:hypothetical protein
MWAKRPELVTWSYVYYVPLLLPIILFFGTLYMPPSVTWRAFFSTGE